MDCLAAAKVRGHKDVSKPVMTPSKNSRPPSLCKTKESRSRRSLGDLVSPGPRFAVREKQRSLQVGNA